MPARPAKNYPLTVISSPTSDDNSEAARPDSPEICAFCYGTGMEVVPGKGARRCRCRIEERQAKLLAGACTPRRYENCSFANHQPRPGNGTRLQAFNYALKLVEEYPAVERGLLFMAPVGTGKTHLSTAILRSLIEKGVPCLFYEFGALLREIQNSCSPVSQTSELKVHLGLHRSLKGKTPYEVLRDKLQSSINQPR